IKVMDASKYDVFELCESTRQELEALQKEHDVIRKELEITIAEVDRLEREFRNARIRLTEVSRDFVRYTEKDIKAAYENATNIQLDLIVQNEKEMNLKARREDLQIRIRNLQKTIKRAELVISKMNV